MARAAPYTVFDAVLPRKQELSPHLMRVTLAGPMVTGMVTWASDQRFTAEQPVVLKGCRRWSWGNCCCHECAQVFGR